MSEILNINGQPVQGDGAVELLKPNGQPVHPPEPKLDKFTEAIISLYNALTEDMKAILASGVCPLYAVLTQTPGTNGLNMRVFPAIPCRVDHVNKRVYTIEDVKDENSAAGSVPYECGNTTDTGAESPVEAGADLGSSESHPQG